MTRHDPLCDMSCCKPSEGPFRALVEGLKQEPMCLVWMMVVIVFAVAVPDLGRLPAADATVTACSPSGPSLASESRRCALRPTGAGGSSC